MYVEDKPAGEPQVKDLWRQQLLDAADYLEAHGWCRGTMFGVGGSACIMGAMWWALDHRHPYDPHGFAIAPPQRLLDLAARVGRYLAPNQPKIHLPLWNDARHRTKRQVLKALRKAAYA